MVDLVRLSQSECLWVSFALPASGLVKIRQQSPLSSPCFQSRFYNVFLIFHRLLLAKWRHSLSVIHGQKCLIRAPLPGNISEVDALDPLPQIRLRAWKSARFWQWFLLAPGGNCREGILDFEKFAGSFVKHRSLVGSGGRELT